MYYYVLFIILLLDTSSFGQVELEVESQQSLSLQLQVEKQIKLIYPCLLCMRILANGHLSDEELCAQDKMDSELTKAFGGGGDDPNEGKQCVLLQDGHCLKMSSLPSIPPPVKKKRKPPKKLNLKNIPDWLKSTNDPFGLKNVNPFIRVFDESRILMKPAMPEGPHNKGVHLSLGMMSQTTKWCKALVKDIRTNPLINKVENEGCTYSTHAMTDGKNVRVKNCPIPTACSCVSPSNNLRFERFCSPSWLVKPCMVPGAGNINLKKPNSWANAKAKKIRTPKDKMYEMTPDEHADNPPPGLEPPPNPYLAQLIAMKKALGKAKKAAEDAKKAAEKAAKKKAGGSGGMFF